MDGQREECQETVSVASASGLTLTWAGCKFSICDFRLEEGEGTLTPCQIKNRKSKIENSKIPYAG
jgi:hypothetical protein